MENSERYFGEQMVVNLLVKWGNNRQDAEKMVSEHWEYVVKTYPEASLSEMANIIRTIY